MSINPNSIIEKLEGLQSQIPSFKGKHVDCVEETEFVGWRDSLVKWLKAGGASTFEELRKVEKKLYSGLLRESDDGAFLSFDLDEQMYQKALSITETLINSAIENLKLGLFREQSKAPTQMRDQYNISQAGAVGLSSHAHDMTFNRIQVDSLNLPQLTEELSTLRKALKNRGSQPEQDVAIGTIAKAEIAARDGDGPKVIECLKKAGKWTWEVATEIGTELAAETLKKTMGL